MHGVKFYEVIFPQVPDPGNKFMLDDEKCKIKKIFLQLWLMKMT